MRWVFLRCRVCRAVRAGSCLQGEVGGQARDRPKGTGPRATGEPRDQARRPRGGLWRGVAPAVLTGAAHAAEGSR